MVSSHKRMLFALVSALTAFLLLGAIEVTLRIAMPSLFRPLFSEITYDGIQWYQVNRSYLEKYFPANSVLVPDFKPSLIRKTRVPGSLRIFCLGESSMFGTPYQMTANIPAILRKQLRHTFPQKEIEVINFGAAAINSNVIVDFAQDLLQLAPNAVVIYTGHNEFYGPDGIGASWLERKLPALTSWKYRLRELGIVRLMQSLLRRASHDPGAEENLMRQVSAEAHVSLGSDDALRVLGNFRRNLDRLIGIFSKENVPVIVSDISSNLFFAPFAYEDHQEFSAIRSDVGAGRWTTARTKLEAIRNADSTNAFIDYWRGRAAFALGDTVAARDLLARARDEDLLKFRAPSQVNRIIKEVCNVRGVGLVPSDSALAAGCPGAIPDTTLFWEHVHPKFEGYYIIAGLFHRALLANPSGTTPPASMGSPLLPCSPDSLGICWLDRAFADLSIIGLTSRWPFTGYHIGTAVIQHAAPEERQVALDVYNRKLGWTEGCLKSAAAFERRHNFAEAITTYKAMLDEYERAYYARYLLATVFKSQGRTGDAMREYALSIEHNPSYPFARVDLGLLLINDGRLDEAEKELNRAVDLTRTQDAPASLRSTALYGLSAIAANKGDYNTALSLVDQALTLVPSYTSAIALRRSVLDHIAASRPSGP